MVYFRESNRDALFGLGISLQKIQINVTVPDIDGLGDGDRSTRLMPDADIVPGLVKSDGYSSVTRFIAERFEVIHGNSEGNEPSNYFESTYH